MMNRRWPQLLGVGLLCLQLGCSRSANDPSPSPSSAPLAAVPDAVPSLSPKASAAGAIDLLVPTPEDAEDAAEQRITEQNLESELDRLEREIQAE